jgi:hypothetical protein
VLCEGLQLTNLGKRGCIMTAGLRERAFVRPSKHQIFRVWRSWPVKGFPRELAEHALAHVIGGKAEQAYRRRRRELMDAWTRHCEGAAGENV